MVRFRFFLCTTACLCMLLGARYVNAAGYKISMLPRYSTEEIYSRITPLVEYLHKTTGLEITPTLTTTFDQYAKHLANGTIDIGYENPYIYVLASKAHEAIAMAVKGKDGNRFRGIIITAAKSPLHNISDLKGKKISIVSYTSAGGYLSQKLSLLEKNIDVVRDCTVEEAPENKQENVVFAVFTGDADAGFIRESALHKVDQFVPTGAIRVLTPTAWLPNWALSLSRDMPLSDKEKIIKAIKAIPQESPVLRALKITALRPTRDSDYDVVRKAASLDVSIPAASKQ